MRRRRWGPAGELLQAHVDTWAKYQGPPGLPELPECRMASGSFPPRGQTTPKQDPSRPPERSIVEGSLPYCTFGCIQTAWLPPTSLALLSALLLH